MRPEITLITKRGPNPVMSKRIFLDEHGDVCSDGSQCLMVRAPQRAPRLKQQPISPSTSWPAVLTRPSRSAL